jgi:endonuclease III
MVTKARTRRTGSRKAKAPSPRPSPTLRLRSGQAGKEGTAKAALTPALSRPSTLLRAGGERGITPAEERAPRIYAQLHKTYPQAQCALDHHNAFELLVATILSAQCTDVRVNQVTPGLFKRYTGPKEFAGAPLGDIEQAVRSTGFYRNKAKAIQGASRILIEKYGGQVPQTMEELIELPGVARKTANVVLGNAFGKNEGVVVDTHVRRLSNRLGLSRHNDPVKIERDLMGLFPRAQWAMLAHLLIFHGRQVCFARKPACSKCAVAGECPKIGVKASV